MQTWYYRLLTNERQSRTKKQHLGGGKSGARRWQQPWPEEDARKNQLTFFLMNVVKCPWILGDYLLTWPGCSKFAFGLLLAGLVFFFSLMFQGPFFTWSCR